MTNFEEFIPIKIIILNKADMIANLKSVCEEKSHILDTWAWMMSIVKSIQKD